MKPLLPCAVLVLATPTSTQVFESATDALPTSVGSNDSRTEQVDFADVDLDGDWDAAFADGGDGGADRNRIWINRGGLQAGTIGTFDDETATRFPTHQDMSRDVEFVDFDADGDPDLYIANSSTLGNETSRFWTNAGGGFYVDETLTRWVGIGASGSSVPNSLVLPGGGFVDWGSDGDFADFDNDGDLDLFHASVGSNHSGNVPSRIFLNDGAGFFSEFNPSGFQLPSTDLQNGQPALWSEGNQMEGTLDTTGTEADVTGTAVDADLGDLDGDFDIDILLGDRDRLPRIHANRLETGSLIFRDISGDAFPPSWASQIGQYEQELGDLDNDGDLDLYGLNWSDEAFGFQDRTFENGGSADFQAPVEVLNSNSDEEEVDFIDYDADGDLDAYVANFSGRDLVRRNVLAAGEFGFDDIEENVAGTSAASRDADVADFDADGDYDVISVNAFANVVLRNITQVFDTTDPHLPRLEQVADGAAAAGVLPVRVQVYDNAPTYVVAHNITQLLVEADGVLLAPTPMRWSGGQVFRGELPANFLGTVTYQVRSSDAYHNVGASPTLEYLSTGVGGTPFGSGSSGTLGVPNLRVVSAPIAGSPLYVACSDVPPGTPVAFFFSLDDLATPLALGDGVVLNVNVPFVHSGFAISDAGGDALLTLPMPASVTGVSFFAQAFALDGTGGNNWASSRGLGLVGQ